MSAWFKGRKSGRALAALDAAGSEFTAAGGVAGAAGEASVCVAGGGGAGISESWFFPVATDGQHRGRANQQHT